MKAHRNLRVSLDRKSTRLNSSHVEISYAVFCLKKKTDRAARVPVAGESGPLGTRSESAPPRSRGRRPARGRRSSDARGHRSCAPRVFFFNDAATTEIYTLSLHDALPIWPASAARWAAERSSSWATRVFQAMSRSEEHTSELQSRRDLVCRLLLEKKK